MSQTEPDPTTGKADRSIAAAVSDLTRVAHEGQGAVAPDELVRAARALVQSAGRAGSRAIASRRWLAEIVFELAGHVQIRDPGTLSQHHGGLTGDALAEELIRTAGRASGSVGAAAGTIVAVEELLPPAWVTVPFELLAETAAVAGIEMKLIAELHEVYGRPVPGAGRVRSIALGRAWAERRGVSPAMLAEGMPALTESLGRGARNQVIRLVRRRLLRRAGANLTSAAPLMIGAAAGAAINRRATVQLGRSVVDDLTRV